MARIKVGSTDCSINGIILTMRNCEGYAELHSNWGLLANSLGTRQDNIAKQKGYFIRGVSTLEDVITDILLNWINRESDAATLGNLISHLKRVQLDGIAAGLNKTFNRDSDAEQSSNTGNSLSGATSSPQTSPAYNPFQIQFDELEHDESDGNCLPNSGAGNDVIDFRNAPNLENVVVVKRPQNQMSFEDDYYELPVEGCKGFALVLNIIKYKNASSVRYGAIYDSKYLSQLLSQLGYQVFVEDVGLFSKQRAGGIIEDFRKKCNDEKPESIIVFIGGHGKHDKLVLSNSRDKMQIYEDILFKFNKANCPGLHRKPKMFLISACQEFETDASQTMPLDDTILCYLTLPGCFSCRYHKLGTVYTYCLTKVFMEEAHQMSFLEMINKIKDVMSKVKTHTAIDQMPNHRDFGFKKLYFNMQP